MLAYTFYEADNRVRRYAEALARRGDEVDAIALARHGQPAFEVLKGVHVYRIQKRVIDERGPFSYLLKLMLFFFRSAWFLAKKQFTEPYKLIHVHSVPDFEVFATIVPRLMGAKIILDIHDIVPEFYASKFRVNEHSLVFKALVMMERLSIAYSDHAIIANHLWYEKLIRRSVRKEKCTPIINSPDPSIFSPRNVQPRTDSNFVLCYPGTLSHHQGLDLAVEAVAMLRDEIPELRLVLIGDGPERENLKRQIKQLGLQDRITLSGLVPMEEVARVMTTIDLGVVPKRADTFGNEAFSTKIMEFMMMGVPVLAARTRVDEYYFSDGLVEFFESGSAHDLAAKILHLRNHPERRAELGAASGAFIQKNHWDVKKENYLAFVDRLTGNLQ
jgi:glycosyltransferase involved in cell wall biosynthesis